MENFAEMKPTSASEIDVILSGRERITQPIFLDSKPYTPFKWPVFFLYAIIIGLSIWLLFRNFIVGDIPSTGILTEFLFAAYAGVFFVPIIATFYLLNLLFPKKLLIDEAGVALWSCGKKNEIKWSNIESISVKDISKYNKSAFAVIVSGKGITLNCDSYFCIDSNTLRDFLILQKSLFET